MKFGGLEKKLYFCNVQFRGMWNEECGMRIAWEMEILLARERGIVQTPKLPNSSKTRELN